MLTWPYSSHRATGLFWKEDYALLQLFLQILCKKQDQTSSGGKWAFVCKEIFLIYILFVSLEDTVT